VYDYGMVPGLAVERLEPPKFLVPLGVGCHQHGRAVLGQHKQQRLVGEQQHLTVTVPALFPAALAGLEIEAAENTSVETVDVAVVNHQVVEGRSEVVRGPALL